MRFVLAAGALTLATLVGCNNNRADRGMNETGAAGGEAVDTVVTTSQTKDTALIRTDTTINVDTTKHEGDQTTNMDTVKNTPGRRGAATTDTTH
jgi:hypothetical protein